MNFSRWQCLYPLLLLWVFHSSIAQASPPESWFSLTFDNDFFVGNDSGYTNGLTFSRFDVAPGADKLKKGFLLKPLAWTLPKGKTSFSVNGYTLGQLMSTPSDISVSVPPEGEIPYAGLLFFTNSYAQRYEGKGYSDRISTTLGFVGPVAQGEAAQKAVHQILGSDEPMGWDTQLENELVFQLSRARAWRTWHSNNDYADIVSTAEMNLGTIESSVSAGAFFRVGKDLNRSYPSLLYFTSRISNPVSPNGWQLFFGLRGEYMLRQIFLDGNTFRDSRSIEYNRDSLGAAGGYSYSFDKVLLTIALYDLNILGSEVENSQTELTRFGTFTLAFKL